MKSFNLFSTLAILLMLAFGSLFLADSALAVYEPLGGGVQANMQQQENAFVSGANLNSSATVSHTISIIIQILLSLLGILFVVLLVYAGFQWMTAEGNEEKVTKAKDTIVRAIIGLVIIIAAYSITYFVFQNLNRAAGGSGSTQNQGGSSGTY